ncbi:phosphoribosylanthranilate isomerase [Companilactobacillus nantensis]|nr:phosphoribosylanthranilate isomerase [Companilactobacillus nantensis]
MTQIKICGLMTSADIQAVNQAQPDLAGFIFAKGRHQLDLITALKLRQELDSKIPSVGVFVNAPLAEMIAIFNSGAISMIQLHGQESEQTVVALQKLHIPVINVFQPTGIPAETQADYLMLDSGQGNGKLIDWSNLNIKHTQPLIIAGALNIQNIEQATQLSQPDIVDISRGVETNGQKDARKIFEIVKLVHQL